MAAAAFSAARELFDEDRQKLLRPVFIYQQQKSDQIRFVILYAPEGNIYNLPIEVVGLPGLFGLVGGELQVGLIGGLTSPTAAFPLEFLQWLQQ